MLSMVVFKLGAFTINIFSSRRSQSPINCIRPSVLGPIKRKGTCIYIVRCFSMDVGLQQEDTFFFFLLFSCIYNVLVSMVNWNLPTVIYKYNVK